jgi:hypothetical protein
MGFQGKIWLEIMALQLVGIYKRYEELRNRRESSSAA